MIMQGILTDRSLGTFEKEMDEGLEALITLRKKLTDASLHQDKIHGIVTKNIASATNLIQYLAYKDQDTTALERLFTKLSLSSIKGSQHSMLPFLDQKIWMLQHLNHSYSVDKDPSDTLLDPGKKILQHNENKLFGKTPHVNQSRIMITLPYEASYDVGLLRELLRNGMQVARINGAQNDASVWLKMVKNIRAAELETGKSCKIHVDLKGRKLRTCGLNPNDAILKVRPKRNEHGQVIQAARIQLISNVNMVEKDASMHYLRISADKFKCIKVGSFIKFKDARNSKRKLIVSSVSDTHVQADLYQTAYFKTGLKLKIPISKDKCRNATIHEIPNINSYIFVQAPSKLLLKRNTNTANPVLYNASGHAVKDASIACTSPQVLEHIQISDSIYFDDGKIYGKVTDILKDDIVIDIINSQEKAIKLRNGKGINLPDTKINLPALSAKDFKDLDFICQYADTVGLSFANSKKDVQILIEALQKMTTHMPGIILKIETKSALRNLPEMLLEVMKVPGYGVMIARGDLAVEAGYADLPSHQKSILDICMAAHCPVIIATQILESLTKKGAYNRAELVDAELAREASCMMLNKGKHLAKAAKFLNFQSLKG